MCMCLPLNIVCFIENFFVGVICVSLKTSCHPCLDVIYLENGYAQLMDDLVMFYSCLSMWLQSGPLVFTPSIDYDICLCNVFFPSILLLISCIMGHLLLPYSQLHFSERNPSSNYLS